MITPTMLDAPNDKQTVSSKGIWALFCGFLSLIPLAMALGWLDTTTELIPSQEKVDLACFAIAAVCTLLAGGLGIYFARKLAGSQRIILPLVIMLEVAICTFLIATHAASFVQGWLNFPAGRTHTRQVLLQISRAYQTHGKGTHQFIQTMPIWSDLEITPEDFTFMQNHRRLGDDGHNPDEVSSRGYFCAKVNVEQSDNALRILHSGSRELPKGTVILCPVSSSRP